MRLYESVIVAVRPGAKPSLPVETTDRTGAADPSAQREVLRRIEAAVTVESIDRKTNVIVYKTGDNRRVVRAVGDPRLLEGVKPGDTIAITYSRERAIALQRVQ